MTQPYPQQYPPQGYGAYAPPQQPQYGQPYPGMPQQPPQAPQSYPGATVTYPAPPVPQQPPSPVTSPAGGGQALGPGAAPALVNNSQSGGTVAPKARHLVGRTVIIEPVRMQRAMNQETNEEVDEAVFHLTVVDGGPLQYGDNQSKNASKRRPNTHEVATPCRFTAVSDMGWGFTSVVRDALDAGQPARVGVIEVSPHGKNPYKLYSCEVLPDDNPRPDGQRRFQVATELWNKIWQDKHAAPGAPRQFVSPEPRSLVAPPAGAQQPQPQVNYGAPAQQPPAGYAQPQGYGAPAYAQQGYGMPAAAPAGPLAPPNGAPFYGMAPAAPQQPSAPPAAAEPDVSHLPPPVQAWLASLPPADRAASLPGVLAQYGGQPAAAPAGPGM